VNWLECQRTFDLGEEGPGIVPQQTAWQALRLLDSQVLESLRTG